MEVSPDLFLICQVQHKAEKPHSLTQHAMPKRQKTEAPDDKARAAQMATTILQDLLVDLEATDNNELIRDIKSILVKLSGMDEANDEPKPEQPQEHDQEPEQPQEHDKEPEQPQEHQEPEQPQGHDQEPEQPQEHDQEPEHSFKNIPMRSASFCL